MWPSSYNLFGQNSPTHNEGLQNVKAISCGSGHTVCLLSDGEVWTFGNNDAGQLGLGDEQMRNTPTKIPSLDSVELVSAGFDFTMCALPDGTFYTFGGNEYGQLCLGPEDQPQSSPMRVSGLKFVKCK